MTAAQAKRLACLRVERVLRDALREEEPWTLVGFAAEELGPEDRARLRVAVRELAGELALRGRNGT